MDGLAPAIPPLGWLALAPACAAQTLLPSPRGVRQRCCAHPPGCGSDAPTASPARARLLPERALGRTMHPAACHRTVRTTGHLRLRGCLYHDLGACRDDCRDLLRCRQVGKAVSEDHHSFCLVRIPGEEGCGSFPVVYYSFPPARKLAKSLPMSHLSQLLQETFQWRIMSGCQTMNSCQPTKNWVRFGHGIPRILFLHHHFHSGLVCPGGSSVGK